MARSGKKALNKGAWTAEEDRKLAHYIHLDGPRRWRTLALKAGLDRCGKSCRLRWLNYLRPNIKRGNISDDEEDLILRLHKLLGNRWSLIAGRLPGRTDNEIKNYWHSHLSKKLKNQCNNGNRGQETARSSPPTSLPRSESNTNIKTVDAPETKMEINGSSRDTNNTNNTNFEDDYFFDFSAEGTLGLEWVAKFLELDEDQ